MTTPRSPGMLVTIVTGALLLLGAGACTWQGLGPTRDHPQRLYVVGELAHLDHSQVVAAAAGFLGAGYFHLDLDGLREAVAALPWTAQVWVHRRWPDGVVIRIREHRPVALWGQTGVLCADGAVLIPAAGERPTGLPQLAGPDGSAERLLQTLPTLRAQLRGSALAIASLRLDARGSWSVVLDNGLHLRLGRHHIEARMARFARYATPVLGPRLETAAYVDLRYADGFAVGGQRAAAKKEGEHEQTT